MATQTKTGTKAYTIDASGRSLGRVASEAAHILTGKNSVAYAKHLMPDVTVTITNASKISIPEKTRANKVYKRFSQYPGGLKLEKLENLAERRGIEVIILHAVRGMIPNNRLRPNILKRLSIVK